MTTFSVKLFKVCGSKPNGARPEREWKDPTDQCEQTDTSPACCLHKETLLRADKQKTNLDLSTGVL